MFLDHTHRRSTVGRTPLDEWSARRRDLYLTTHDTHNRQISMSPMGFEPKISAGERPQAARLLRSWVRIPSVAWIFVCCECRVLSGGGLCDGLITRPEESYRLWCVVVCDLETARMRRSWPTGGCCTKRKKEGCYFMFSAESVFINPPPRLHTQLKGKILYQSGLYISFQMSQRRISKHTAHECCF